MELDEGLKFDDGVEVVELTASASDEMTAVVFCRCSCCWWWCSVAVIQCDRAPTKSAMVRS